MNASRVSGISKGERSIRTKLKRLNNARIGHADVKSQSSLRTSSKNQTGNESGI